MKWYHFGLVFAVIAMGFFVMMQVRLVNSMQREELQRQEYDALVAAVNGAAEVAFGWTEETVNEEALQAVEEVFFQTLAVLHGGTPDAAECAVWREYVPVLAVFAEQGCYLFCFKKGKGHGWSELIPYEDEEIPNRFFSETETILTLYHTLHGARRGNYRMEAAEEGVWEKRLSKACVFAVYAPPLPGYGKTEREGYLYAAAERTTEVYYVTEDTYYHVPSCGECKMKNIVARYNSQKECALDGAWPCEKCLKQ